MKIAYLTNCFGTQSHTFIRREIVALRQINVDIALFGVRRDLTNTAPEATSLVEETDYLYPLRTLSTVKSICLQAIRHPLRFFSGAVRAFSEEEFSVRRRLKMLYHFLVTTDMARRLKDRGITHVHAHFMNASASIAMYASYHAQIPFSITVHSAGTYKTPHILGVKQKLKEAQMLLMISAYNIEYFNRIYPCREKSHVVRCGMNLAALNFEPASPATENKMANLLGVGRFVEKKGFIYLIQACQLLADRGFKFKLTLVGNGPLSDELKKAVVQNGLSGAVSFLGKLSSDKVEEEMRKADIVIVPSVTSQTGEMEGLPVVIMEAMSIGIPVIATRHSGIPEIVLAGETGTLVEEKSPQGLADAIISEFTRKDNTRVFAAKDLLVREYDINVIAAKRKRLFAQADKG